jgi:hypothetical protein
LAEQQLFFVGNQQPSITETITDENGLPIDLSSDSVRFKMRPVGSITLKVDAAVSNTPGADGVVRYDWSITDTDTPGRYLVWWEVTNTQGEKQDLAEALIEFRAHGPLSNSYIELEELKSSTELTSTSFADQDLQNAIVSASRAVDFYTGRRFWPDLVDQTRYFTGNGTDRVDIDDLITSQASQQTRRTTAPTSTPGQPASTTCSSPATRCWTATRTPASADCLAATIRGRPTTTP